MGATSRVGGLGDEAVAVVVVAGGVGDATVRVVGLHRWVVVDAGAGFFGDESVAVDLSMPGVGFGVTETDDLPFGVGDFVNLTQGIFEADVAVFFIVTILGFVAEGALILPGYLTYLTTASFEVISNIFCFSYE